MRMHKILRERIETILHKLKIFVHTIIVCVCVCVLCVCAPGEYTEAFEMVQRMAVMESNE